MKKYTLLSVLLLLPLTALFADANASHPKKSKAAHTLQHKKSAPKSTLSKKEIEKQIKIQMEREKKYAKEQKFYTSDEYNFSAVKVDPKTVESVPVIEPDYDFDITDVYRDDQ